MEDNTVRIIKWTSIGVMGFFASCAGCTMHENYLLAQTINNGADPISAACAITPNSMTETLCAVTTMKKNAGVAIRGDNHD